MPEGKLWKGMRSTKREKKMLENAVVTDGEMVGCSQMEMCWRALLLWSGQLLENRLGANMSEKPQNGFHLQTSATGRKRLVHRSLCSCIRVEHDSSFASSVSCPQRSLRNPGWNSSRLGWEVLMLATKNVNTIVVFLAKYQCCLEPDQHCHISWLWR